MHLKRHPAGSSEGGQFAGSPQPDEPQAKVGNLPVFLSPENYTRIAASQLSFTDTAAELWYQHGHKRDVQHKLRSTPTDDPYDISIIPDSSIRYAQNLQASILKAKLPSSTIVYRGMTGHIDEPSWGLTEMTQIGDTFRGVGFWSTTIDPDIAKDFAVTRGDGIISVLYKIETPIGKCLLSSSSDPSAVETEFWEEYEIILPHGAEYTVTDKQYLPSDYANCNPYLVISLEYVNCEKQNLAELLSHKNQLTPHAEAALKVTNSTVVSEVERMLKRYKDTGSPVGDYTNKRISL